MTATVKELRAMSDEEIIAMHDGLAKNTSAGIDLYLNELLRRDQEKATKAIMGLTKVLVALTFMLVVLTAVVLALTWVLVQKGA